jgi:hypothetical protein
LVVKEHDVNGKDLAAALNVSKARVSQYVSSGKLDGCFTGAGRERRFDLEKVHRALGRELHPGQMLGNGAQTRKALRELSQMQDEDEQDGGSEAAPRGRAQKQDSRLNDDDDDAYALVRTQKAQEEVRKLRRVNAEAEGSFVLASEVTRATQRLISQEIAEFESVLRDGARKVADQLGVDFKVVRQILVESWRAHRHQRSAILADQSAKEDMTQEEREADI